MLDSGEKQRSVSKVMVGDHRYERGLWAQTESAAEVEVVCPAKEAAVVRSSRGPSYLVVELELAAVEE